MSSLRFTSTYQAVNLFRNGHFDLVTSAGIPAVWEVNNAGLVGTPEGSAGNTYEVLTEQDLSAGPERALRLTLQSGDSVELVQPFTADAGSQVFDFQTPASANQYPALMAGYPNVGRARISQGTYTLAWSYQGVQGDLAFEPFALDLNGAQISLQPQEGKPVIQLRESENRWRRLTSIISTTTAISKLGLRVSRQPGTDLAVVDLSLLSFTLGAYSTLPYVGDPLVSSIPQGAVVLSMGSGCPPGFEEIGNGDSEPLAEWLAFNPEAQARKGNFPRSDNELTGTELHGSEVKSITPGKVDIVNFVSQDSKTVVEDEGDTGPELDYKGSNPDVDAPGGLNGTPDHPHTFEPAPTRPSSRAFRFCKRL